VRAVSLEHGGFLWMQDGISGVEVEKAEGECGQLETRLPLRPGKRGGKEYGSRRGETFFPFRFSFLFFPRLFCCVDVTF